MSSENKFFKLSEILLIFMILPLFAACGEDEPEVWDQRIIPTYVCEGSTVIPKAFWEYRGPKGKVQILSKTGELLCSNGARKEKCTTFSRPLTKNDVPLKLIGKKAGKKVWEDHINYQVLSGPEETEAFKAEYDWEFSHSETVEDHG